MPPGMLLQAVLFLFLLVVVSVWDIKDREIPDGLQAAIALLSLLHFSPWNLAGALTALPYLLVALAGKGTGGIGGGDIKLAAILGIPFGATGLMAVLAVSCILVLLHMGMLAICRKERPKQIPFAPYIFWGSFLYTLLLLPP